MGSQNENAFEGIAPDSLSPQSDYGQPSEYPSYDVFINHRGPDVKKTLADALYRHLSAFNLRVFLDQKELQTGDFLPAAIQHALATCKIHVAIFSPRYAESPWCLAELSFMLKTGAKIIPVFYDVQPSHARYINSGPYAQAFKDFKSKNRIDLRIVEKWKDDLHRVSFISGLVFDTSKDDKDVLLRSIVDRVVEETKGEVLEVAKHPVGLDDALQAFQNTISKSDQEQNSYEKVVGIVGMGGSGKTTLAKKIYNERSWAYKGRCCFLSDVRLEAGKNGLASLQSKLLQKLLHYDFKIDNASQGKEILRDRLQNREILMVLDDVDKVEQMDALLVKEVIGERSLVIVTSRDKGILTSCGVVLFHEVKGMGESHARELFCWHAFLLPYPQQGFEALVESFLIACSGLPLSLKVIGSFLHKKNIAFWNGTLEKIGKHILDKDIINILKISYDGLDREEKEIFLDIAWFFAGEEKNMLMKIWDGSGWSSLQSLENLEQKCLIEFVHENQGYENKGEDRLVVRMHDHLRDMGRSVIDNQTQPSRLWRPEDIRSYLSRRQLGLVMEVRGICTSPAPDLYASERTAVPMSTWKACWLQVLEICGVSTMLRGYPVQVVGSALRLLAAQGDSVITEFSDFSRELLWLRWDDCPYTSIPSHFSMQKLRVLELLKGSCQLDTLWQSHKQAPTQLRELSVHHLKNLPGSIGLLKHLEKIVLRSGLMETLPDELCELKSLNHLDLGYCYDLQSLPHNFGYLTNLRHLDLTNCGNLKTLPDSFNQLIQLQYLSLYFCDGLMISSDILRNIRTLEYLDYTSIRVESLPTHITSQSFLTNLYVRCSTLRELPVDMGELGNLKVVEVENTAITSIPTSLEKLTLLKSLSLSGCLKLSCIPESIGQLKNLQYLTLNTTGIQLLPQGLVHLSNLVKLTVQSSPVGDVILSTGDEELSAGLSSKPYSFPSHYAMSRLKFIYLGYTNVLVKLFISKNACPNLETLEVVVCVNLEEVKGLPIALVSLRLYLCDRLKKISGLSNLTKLRDLNLCGCLDLHELEDLSQLTSLESLIADGCCVLTKMEGLECLSLLKDIQIAACHSGVWKGINCLKRLPSKVSSITLNMKTVGGDGKEVNSILSSFMFPVSVVEFPSWWVCKLGVEEVRSCAAVMLVFLCESSVEKHNPHLYQDIIRLGNKYSMQEYKVIVKFESECQWIILSVFTRESAFVQDLKIIKVEDDMGVYANLPFESNKGWLVLLRDGEEWKIQDIWEKIFTYAYSKQAL